MDVNLLEQIVKLMSANDLNTVEVRDGDKRVILKRGAVQQTVTYTPGPPAGLAASPASASSPPTQAPTAPTAPVEDPKLTAIKSPMVGTFYAAPSPGAKPFVTIGSAVNEETDVCTIEAMKNFLLIKAETRGTISKILVKDGETVQYGQTLFLVKP
jgi:acetyl-CoA carboxylase biotin carboxyl carrier protein